MKKLVVVLLTVFMIASSLSSCMLVCADEGFAAPNQIYFNDFEGVTEVPEGFSGGSGILSVADGMIKVNNNGSDWYPRLISPSIPVSDKPVVIEFNQIDGNISWNEFGIRPKDGGWKFVSPSSAAGIKYVIYDPVAGSYTFYESDLTSGTNVTGLDTGASSFNFRTEVLVYSDRYVGWDYVAVYEYEKFDLKLENITTTGATLKTTAPIDVLSTLKVDDKNVAIEKIDNTYNTYKIAFSDELNASSQYTLSGNVKYLGSASATEVSEDFVTPKAEYAAPNQIYFNDFEATTEVPEGFSGGSGILSVADGMIKVNNNGSDWYPRLISPSIPVSDKPVVIEFNQIDGNISWNEFGIRPKDGGWKFVSPSSAAGIKYVIYDPVAGSYTFYESDLTFGTNVTGLDTGASSFNFRTEVLVYSDRYVGWDYVAVYEYGKFALKLENVTTTGATLKTTIPIDTASSLNVNGDPVKIEKVADNYNTYTITFENELDELTSYTLSGNAIYLGSANAMEVCEDFETPKRVFKAPKQYLFNDFEDVSDVPYGFSGASGILSVEDGMLKVTTNGSDWYPRLVAQNVPVENQSVIIEFDQIDGNVTVVEFGIYPSGGSWKFMTPQRGAGIKYAIYNPAEGTYAFYEDDFTLVSSVTGLEKDPENFSFRTEAIVYPDRYLAWDYVAVYQCDKFMYEISDITTNGAVLKTTRPVSLSSVLTLDGNSVEISKVSNKYNEYELKFSEELIGESDYALGGSLEYLGGEASVTVNCEFTTPKRAYEFENLDVQNSGNGVKAVINAANNTNNAKTIYLAVAAYENGGTKLAGVKFNALTIPANTEKTDYFTDELNAMGTNVTFKAFAWDTNLKPVNLIFSR